MDARDGRRPRPDVPARARCSPSRAARRRCSSSASRCCSRSPPGGSRPSRAPSSRLAISIPLLAAANGDESIAAISRNPAAPRCGGGRLLLALVARWPSSAIASIGAAGVLSTALATRPPASRGIAVTTVRRRGPRDAAGREDAAAGARRWTEAADRQLQDLRRRRALERRVGLRPARGRGGFGALAELGRCDRRVPPEPRGGDRCRRLRLLLAAEARRRPHGRQRPFRSTSRSSARRAWSACCSSCRPWPRWLVALALFVRRRPRDPTLAPSPSPHRRPRSSALHAAGDWDWQMPAIILPAVALAAGTLKVMSLRDPAATRPARCPRGSRSVSRPASRSSSSRDRLVSANALAEPEGPRPRTGDLPDALARARSAARLSPQDPEPRLLQANLLSDLGRTTQADAAFAAALGALPPRLGDPRRLGIVARTARRRTWREGRGREGARPESDGDPAEVHPRGGLRMSADRPTAARTAASGPDAFTRAARRAHRLGPREAGTRDHLEACGHPEAK